MFERNIEAEVRAYLKIMPVVLLLGARQTGKTTFTHEIMKKNGWHYVTLDDEASLSFAKRNPEAWVEGLPKPIVIDEVQRVPEIFLAIKRDVDENRSPGRYLLTGSANPFLLPKLGDSLAGRMGIVSMFPFSQGELLGVKETFIKKALNGSFDQVQLSPIDERFWCEMMLRGGYPPVHSLESLGDAKRWVNSYLQTMMERDVRDISNIEGLREFPRLFRLIATRSSNLLNVSELSRSLGMVNMTLNRYLRLLETLFFIHLLPAWYTNLGKRMIKSPKLHICDTGIMAQLMDINVERLQSDRSLFGQYLESFVFSELMKQKSWCDQECELFHFRNGDHEVDFILEKADGGVVGIEVKASLKVGSNDARGLLHLKQLIGKRFHRGIVLYLGTKTELLGEKIEAIPVQSLWSKK
ncbi:MAG: hypothetical protein SP1CHLAM54_02870 [Chlamydiia bacterium]|nr:hypothetical protein [Chlamydiia bacterium]MCH9615203.1 hypothetical protein [Chlamydiia bacterium]MCH9628475.1 hypothetical protein [Chlamydiia bacterium]